MRLLPPLPARAGQLVLIYPLAALAGWLFQKAGVPLPFMIGPLVATATLYVCGLASVIVPVESRPAGQLVVAAQVGLSFSPAAFAALFDLAPLLVGLALLTAGCGFLVALLLARMARLPLVAALLATMPTSPVEAAIMAERFDIPPGPVILAQTLRIAAIVVLVPVGIYLVDGWPDRSAVLRVAATPDPAGIALLVAAGILGGIVCRRLRIANPYFLGPLATSAALTAAGVEPAPFPTLVLAGAQILLGTWLGSTFRRSLFQSAGRLLGAILCSTLAMLILTVSCGLALAFLLGLPWEELVLAAAPGGVTEMALTAKFLGQDVAIITAFHLVRIFLIVPNFPWVATRLHRRATRS